MVAGRAVGLAAFAAVAAGGVALGYFAERRLVAGPDTAEPASPLEQPASGSPLEVWSPDGTRLAAQVSGPAGGRPVLLVHGMGLGHEIWHHQRLALQRECRVVTFDLRGHGASGAAVDGDYSTRALADDVIAVLQTAVPGGRGVVLVGHSIGGMALLAALRDHPEIMRHRVTGLGLVSTAGRDVIGSVARSAAAVGANMLQSAAVGSRPARWLHTRLQAPRAARTTDLSFLLTRTFGMSAGAAPDAVLFVDRLNRRTPAAVLGALAHTLATVDELDLLADVAVPTVVMVGEQDRLTPPAQAEAMVERLHRVDFVRIPDAGHTPMVEQPDAVTGGIRQLLRAAARRAAPTGTED